MKTLLENAPMFLSLILAILCVTYIALASYFLMRVRNNSLQSNQIAVLRKIRRYCDSMPRTESVPVTAIERLIDAIELANMEVDIDAIVIEELFKTQKG